MNFVKNIDKIFHNAVNHVVLNKEKYVQNPLKDFTRKRKFPMEDVITHILTMNGGTLKKEMYDLSKAKKIRLTPSAFVQQRSKISSDAFMEVFYQFNKNCVLPKKHRGYKLLAVDGSDVSCPRNPKSKFFLVTAQQPKGYNQVRVNALYDILNNVYIDMECQPRATYDERLALIRMLRRRAFDSKTIIIADRGYESYNMFAHFLNTNNVDFICRVKHGSTALVEVQKLPWQEVDKIVSIPITTTQTKEDKLMGRRFIQTGSKKEKKNSPKTVISRWDFDSPHDLKVRIVRFMLDTGEYETLVTSLSREIFPIEEIRKLYHMRWAIETSFRDLKYQVGLINLHSKKDDLILQEIYASLTMYNYCSVISGSVDVNKKHSKYEYKVNFAMAVYICKKMCRSNKKDYHGLICDISNYAEPIRPGRRDERNVKRKGFVGFVYRVVA